MIVHCCIDSQSPSTASRDPLFKAWLVAEFPIRQVLLEDQDGNLQSARYGQARHDVGQAFPSFPQSSRSGLTFVMKAQGAGEASWLRIQDAEGAWWRLPLDLNCRVPQSFSLTSKHHLGLNQPEAKLRSLTLQEEADERLEQALSHGAGLVLRLDLINKCNLRCIMCHYSQDEVFSRPAKVVSPEDFRRHFEPIAPFLREVMLSCGDEPLASRHFSEILSYVREKSPGAFVCFCTNAMLLRPNLQQVIIENQVNQVMFSVDGVQRATFESIRVGARYEQVLGNILSLGRLRALSGSALPEFKINFVMMVRNIQEAPLMVKVAQTLGVAVVDFRHVVSDNVDPDSFQYDREHLSAQPGRFNFYRQLIHNAAEEAGIRIWIPPAFEDAEPWYPGPDETTASLADFENLLAKQREASTPALPLTRRDYASKEGKTAIQDAFNDCFCPRPFSEMTIRNQDEVLPCPFYAKPLGHLSETPSLHSIFHGEAFRRLRANMLRPEGDPGCANCPLKAQNLPQ